MRKIKLYKKQIDAICEESENIQEALLGIYAECFGDEWAKIEKLNGFPLASNACADYCVGKMRTLQQNSIEANLLWLNNGFGSCPAAAALDRPEYFSVTLCDYTLAPEKELACA